MACVKNTHLVLSSNNMLSITQSVDWELDIVCLIRRTIIKITMCILSFSISLFCILSFSALKKERESLKYYLQPKLF